MPLQLVPSPAAPDLARFAQDMAEGVESGDITGLAVVVMLKGRRFFVDVIGQTARFPHETRGLLLELDDCLREIARKRRESNTTL